MSHFGVLFCTPHQQTWGNKKHISKIYGIFCSSNTLLENISVQDITLKNYSGVFTRLIKHESCLIPQTVLFKFLSADGFTTKSFLYQRHNTKLKLDIKLNQRINGEQNGIGTSTLCIWKKQAMDELILVICEHRHTFYINDLKIILSTYFDVTLDIFAAINTWMNVSQSILMKECLLYTCP